MSRRRQWSTAEARDWHDRQPWFAGCNFVPSTALNQLEMWQAGRFDPETIDRELGWASGLGFNAARVYLHDLLWAGDQAGLLSRMDRYLSIAAGHGIGTMFVLFDGVWDPHPHAGPQPPPRPHLHNPGWVQSPGAAILGDPALCDRLEGYVKGVVGRFASDDRVVAWDIFNEPDNPNPAYTKTELPDKAEKALLLLRRAYGWVRDAAPSQPITSGVWRPEWVHTGALSEMDGFQLTESDVISFHAYTGPSVLLARIADLERYERPLLLTEFMARPFGSTFEAVLPILRERKIGAFSWGLVAGKTQTQYPWDSWTRPYETEPEVWFHDILRRDGTPFDAGEVETIRRLTKSRG